MELENAIFQDLESLGKERIFKMATVKTFWILTVKMLKNILEGI